RHQGDDEAAARHREAAAAFAAPGGTDPIRLRLAHGWQLLQSGRWAEGAFHEALSIFEEADTEASELSTASLRLEATLDRADALTRLGRDIEAHRLTDEALYRCL